VWSSAAGRVVQVALRERSNVVGVEDARPGHAVFWTEIYLGRQSADVRRRQHDENLVETIDRLVAGQHKDGAPRPIWMHGPADLATPHQGLCPAACSSSASRCMVSAFVASCSLERSPHSSRGLSLSAARRARSACSSLQWGARCSSVSFAVTEPKAYLQAASERFPRRTGAIVKRNRTYQGAVAIPR
jgi:hypothetical protein